MIIFDLDGTLADGSHRVHFILRSAGDLTPKDWDSYFAACSDDSPITPVIDLLRDLWTAGNRIGIWTGRYETTRHQTLDWLRYYIGAKLVSEIDLQMRAEGDFTHDDELKHKWLLEARELGEQVSLVFEDRDRVVKMWRREGIVCCQVKEGDF